MIDLDEIKSEIERLKHQDTTYKNCERLAVLATVLTYFQPERTENPYSFASSKNAPMSVDTDAEQSEFIKAVHKAGYEKALSVIDEHMSVIQLIYPKEYSLIINNLLQ